MSNEQLASLALRDPLSFGVLYIDLLEKRQWEIENRRWAIEPYQAVNPYVIERNPVGVAKRVVYTKSTQAGLSTTGMVKMFHFATNWPVRIFYTLPRQQDVIDFVTTRVNPMINASPYLRSKLGDPDSAHAKQIGDSYLFFMELSVEPRMMPADALFVDEVDLSNPDFMATALNRLDASRWKLETYLSTPTLPNYGIDALYHNSDMREWLVKCEHCGHEQPLDWVESVKVEGPLNDPTRVYYGCVKCGKEITLPHIQTGRWVPQQPALTDETLGYHIHQMLTTTAWDLYKIYRNPMTKLVEFYRKRLGKPYDIGGGSLDRNDILEACFDTPYEPETEWDGKSRYYLGADQGNEIQVVIGKKEPDSERVKIVHIELIQMTEGFAKLAQLMRVYHVRKAVVDGNPNRHDAISLVKEFPGKVIVADYIDQKEPFTTKKAMRELPEVTTNVTINRTTGFDGLMESIKDGLWQLPGGPPRLTPMVELIIDHVTALKRDVETRRTASGEVPVAVWRKLGPEHLAHAWLYLKTALEIQKGKNLRVAVVGMPEEEQANDSIAYKPNDDVISEITALLAEVPAEQLQGYLTHWGKTDGYVMPFPLKYKMGLVMEDKHNEIDILYVVVKLLKDKLGT